MDFDELVKSLQEFVGVSRKNSIEKVTKTLGEVYNISGEVLLDFGDDASAIDIGNNQVILLAADGIWGQLMSVNPYWAGYCSVLVNVNDIAAMGGKPIAMVNTMSIFDDEIYDDLLQGIVDGCKKFNVPMVGGHLHPDSEFNSLDVAIAGIAKKDSLMEDDAINFASYNDFINRDKRTFGQMYWSFLKFKQSIIFTFFTNSKGILRSTKITLFILFFAFYMAFTALFFNDSIMRKIYIYKGSTDAAVHVPNVILSSLCSFIASLIVRYVCLGERDIFKAIHEKSSEKKRGLLDNALVKAKIKIYILYGLSAMLICLCWYYASAFCAVFKNSQGHYLTNTIVAFIVCNLWPILTSLIPAFMRIKAKEKKSSKLYIASKIVSIF